MTAKSKKQSANTTLVELKGVQVNFGTFVALSDITFSVMGGARIGLVGPNGVGKSTLLKLLARTRELGDGKPGHEDQFGGDGEFAELEKGNISFAENLTLAYVPQIAEQAALSGGEKTKRILAGVFTQHQGRHKDLYLFDEPTNNLDADGLEWLEREIQKIPATSAVVIVSHDRDFLDRAVNQIVEVDEYSRTIRHYECTYSEYREIRKKEIEEQWKKYEEEKEELGRLRKSGEQRLDWMHKIERERNANRTINPKEKEKPVAAYMRDKEGRMGKRASVIKDRAERMVDKSDVEKPITRLPLNLEFDFMERSGEIVFEIKNAICNRGKREAADETEDVLVGPFNLEVHYGERLHVSGKNGSGKTTLIKLLLGELSPVTGEIIKGSRVQVGYLPQEDTLLASSISIASDGSTEHKDIIDTVCSIMGVVRDDEQEGLFRMTLKRFGFEDTDARKRVDQLSAGERSRLQLALMKMMKPNCVILDEPTNHLDIECVEALEKALKDFKGTLIVVSHDKRFVEKVGLTREFNLL